MVWDGLKSWLLFKQTVYTCIYNTRKLHRWKTLRHYAIGWREQKLNDWVNKKAVEWFWRMIWVWFSKWLFCLCAFFSLRFSTLLFTNKIHIRSVVIYTVGNNEIIHQSFKIMTKSVHFRVNKIWKYAFRYCSSFSIEKSRGQANKRCSIQIPYVPLNT